MSQFRRGFKAEAEEHALELRMELGLTAHEPLDVFALAKHLEIPVLRLADIQPHCASETSVRHFHVEEPKDFSALTLVEGTRAIIVYNEVHARVRTANSVAHEVSHVVLAHERRSHVMLGCRCWDARQEDEATWLGGCLLVPRSAALEIALQGIELDEAARRFGVSKQLMRMRLNRTGASKQAQRTKVRCR